jgi:hypothetical protein
MRRIGLIWTAATAVIAGIASYLSYEAGLSAGLATKLPAGAGPYYAYGPHWGWGFGLPFFGFFWLFVLLFLLFGLSRGFARGRRSPGAHDLHEWHRRAHEHDPGSPPG